MHQRAAKHLKVDTTSHIVLPRVLRNVSTVLVSESKHFVAQEHLAEANVGFTGPDFQRLFFGYIEENVPAGKIATHSLFNKSFDPEILVELGQDKRVIYLAHFFELLKRQSQGQSGPLIINAHNHNVAYCFTNYANIGYVHAFWFSIERYWCLWGGSVGGSLGWNAGHQFLSQATGN